MASVRYNLNVAKSIETRDASSVDRSCGPEGVESQIQSYRRRRRRHSELHRKLVSSPIDMEAETIIGFADMWAPYGGPSDGEIFVRYGMSRTRFSERLWQLCDRSGIDPATKERLLRTFPRSPSQRRTVTLRDAQS